MRSEADLIAACMALMGAHGTLSSAERMLVKKTTTLPPENEVAALRHAILCGEDPLGVAFVRLRTAAHRRATGAVYTPAPIVHAMVSWLALQGVPQRIVDPGAGSGRFILAAAAAFPGAQLVAIEMDPLAALMLRANLSVRGWGSRALVMVQDYRQVRLPRCRGMTAFIGNPPYVRHHDIAAAWKGWYTAELAKLGIKASALAGLHLHFFLKTLLLASNGDVGALITASEWLDVNYGSALRGLLMGRLGGTAIHVLDPAVAAFPGTATTAAIACFRVGETQCPVRVRSIKHMEHLSDLTQGTDMPRATLAASPRWSLMLRSSKSLTHAAAGIELGELFRVHRGQVTGANRIWIAGPHAAHLPDCVLWPAVTKARELFEAGAYLRSAAGLRRVVDIPADLDALTTEARRRVENFVAWAKASGGDKNYIAQHRKAWWSVGLRDPAPILCTYMARRPPQFTRNACAARHINIAHGLYPRQPMDVLVLDGLVAWLNNNTGVASGRTYAGGLTKFEPKEIERLRIPDMDQLVEPGPVR